MKRPITWSDDELRKAGNAADKFFWLNGWSLRWMRPFLTALNAIHPQEAAIAQREAEREAHLLGMADGATEAVPSLGWTNHRYPSLTPPSPPPLVLSTGTWTREPNHRWSVCDPSQAQMYDRPVAICVSDHEKLAAWLREHGDDHERQ